MRHGIITGLLVALILTGLGHPALAGDAALSPDSTLEGIFRRGLLRVGFDAGYMPFEMISKRSGLREKNVVRGDERHPGSPAMYMGFDVDVGVELAKALGVKFVPVNTQWPSIIAALTAGRFDVIMSGMSITEERRKRIDFSDPYMVIGQTILLNPKHKARVKSYKDLNHSDFTVASNTATTGEAAVKRLMPNCRYRPYGEEVEGARAVLESEVDAFVYDLPFNAVFQALYGKGKLIFLDEPFTKEDLAWGIRKNDPDFKKFLNEFLQQLKADGRYERIYKKWFENTDWHAHIR
jgi:polar amino acid transport system substrate-binding protein